MFEYKFVKLKLRKGFWTMKPSADYHQVIDEHARQGWRLKQIFSPNISAHGNASFFEMIFEKPVSA